MRAPQARSREDLSSTHVPRFECSTKLSWDLYFIGFMNNNVLYIEQIDRHRSLNKTICENASNQHATKSSPSSPRQTGGGHCCCTQKAPDIDGIHGGAGIYQSGYAL